MDFDLNEDQTLLLTAIDGLTRPYERPGGAEHFLPGEPIEADLFEGGFFEVCREGKGKLIDAMLLVERVARLPHSVEVSASTVAPMLCKELLPRPLAMTLGTPGQPVRFLERARTLLFENGTSVKSIAVADLKVEPVPSIFGYTYGRAQAYDLPAAETLPVSLDTFKALCRISLAAEITGAAMAALEKTTQYVKERQQFGQPIGAFQAIQHRLSECAVIVRNMHLLMLKAAASATTDEACMAQVYAQRNVGRVCYDLQQFHGAIGLTLEYPLHYWIQRLKALQGELGGAAAASLSIRLNSGLPYGIKTRIA